MIDDGKKNINDPTVSERARYRFRHYLGMGDFPSVLRELQQARAFATTADLAHEAPALRAWLQKRAEFRHPHSPPDEDLSYFHLED